MDTFSIGQVAKRSGVSIDTVRYYERSGLLTPAGRMASGYRRYGELELRRLRFIRRAKSLGFTLEEVSALLALSDGRDLRAVKQAAQARLAEVERRLADLELVRGGLRTLIAACPGHGRAADCPILLALNQDEAK